MAAKMIKLLVVTLALGLSVANAQVVISTPSPLTGATNGVYYSQTFKVTGGTGPYTWVVSAGILPPGLALSAAGAAAGVLNGTPIRTGRHYGFSLVATDSLGSTSAAKAFDMHVFAKFTYGNPQTTPANCTHTNAIYATGDLNTCTVPGEVPLGTFTIPAVGGSFTDSTFGTQVTVVSAFPSTTTYYDPSAFSATGKYAAITVNGQVTIINPVTGAVVRANAPGLLSTNTLEWDKWNDDKYYWPEGPQLKMATVSTGVPTVLIDFSTAINPATGLAFGLSSIDNGGTGDLSSDSDGTNWIALFSDNGHHLAILVNLANLHIYSADYRITRNGITPDCVFNSANSLTLPNGCPGGTTNNRNGFVGVTRGVDSVSGKRYVMAHAFPEIIFSLTGDPNNGLLVYERLGPEMPTNSFDKAVAGNDNNICEKIGGVMETCFFEGHGTMFQTADGQQHYCWIDGQGLNFKASSDGESRGIICARFNAGDLMLRSSAYEVGGGRADVWLEYSVAQAGDPYKDNHPGGAAHAPYLVISQDPDNRASNDLTSLYVHTAHDGNICVMKGLGEEIRCLVYARTIVWGTAINTVTNISNTTPIVVATNGTNAALEGQPICMYNTGLAAVDVRTSGLCRGAHILTTNTFSLNGSVASGTPSSYTAICDSNPCGAHTGVNPQYWPRQFASISGDGSRIIYNSNLGYYTGDAVDTVLTALTGFSAVKK